MCYFDVLGQKAHSFLRSLPPGFLCCLAIASIQTLKQPNLKADAAAAAVISDDFFGGALMSA